MLPLLKPIDRLLDRVTMYTLLLWYLIALLCVAGVLGLLGHLAYSPLAIAATASYLCVICWTTNEVFRRGFDAPSNYQSSFLTALILALIITPAASTHDALFLTAAGGLAVSSKYILAIRKQHIFNPAAVAVALTALGAGQAASWWVGSTPLLPFVVAGGLLVMRKIRREHMVASFVAVALAATVLYNLLGGHSPLAALGTTLEHSSLFFLAFVMLTEPLTSPSTRVWQIAYGALAGVLFPPEVHIGSLYSTPELTIVASNIFAYIVSPKIKLVPSLKQKIQMAPDVWDFVFTPERRFAYQPGQYMEWTLPHRLPDLRGSRRYFTLASSPTESDIRVGVKFYEPGSSYKRALLAMDGQTPVAAGQLGGDFVLPKDQRQKLVFIAGGIGITPFRSMLKYLIDMRQQRDIVVLYAERDLKEICYGEVLMQARQQLGVKVVLVLSGERLANAGANIRSGLITPDLIREEVPDFESRSFYISGPHGMVMAMQDGLDSMGVASKQVHVDFFPGYV